MGCSQGRNRQFLAVPLRHWLVIAFDLYEDKNLNQLKENKKILPNGNYQK